VDTILGYGLYYPWSLSNASRRHRTRESTPRVHQTRGMLRTANAIRLGIHRGRFTRSGTRARSNRLVADSTGCLPRSPSPAGSRSRRDSNSARVVCLISALAHHGLTTQVPHSIDLALPSHAQIPKIDGVPLRVFWYSEPSFSAGIETVRMDEVPVRIYSPEKTIADCFKYRNKIGLDLAIEALRAYRDRTPKPNFQALAKFAQINRVQKVMRPYLEAVL